jgi:hypothetical protein
MRMMDDRLGPGVIDAGNFSDAQNPGIKSSRMCVGGDLEMQV